MVAISPAIRLAVSRIRPFSRQITLAVAFPFIWMLVSSTRRDDLASSFPFSGSTHYKPVPIPGPKIPVTIVNDTLGGLAVCLDGSPPGFHFQAGTGDGASKWVIFLEGGAWCDSIQDCHNRSLTKLGSSNQMQPYKFIGILSPDPEINPEFFSWNRVVVRYCDGASFSGNKNSPIKVPGQNSTFIFFRGSHIMLAVVNHLLQHHNLRAASHVLFGGGSAGALAAFLHCDWFAKTMLQESQPVTSPSDAAAAAADGAASGGGAASSPSPSSSLSSPSSFSPPVVKCMGDGGIFLDTKDVGGQHEMRKLFSAVVRLQNVSVHQGCLEHLKNQTAERWKCFFPEYFLPLLDTPLFIGNTLYDSWQMNYSFAVPASFHSKDWDQCRWSLADCPWNLLRKFHTYRAEMVKKLQPLMQARVSASVPSLRQAGQEPGLEQAGQEPGSGSRGLKGWIQGGEGVRGGKEALSGEQGRLGSVKRCPHGFFLASCHMHTMALWASWHGLQGPLLSDQSMAQAVADWFFERKEVRLVDEIFGHNPSCPSSSQRRQSKAKQRSNAG
ncbi:hypothetical protein CLOP_g10976 [Closterium sp. NIES-67]|nr:hypothetical protein CLOP_g5907 [Closterium sp. NIES-67]GJP80774.1 hypothetical protein CLOP_g10976 [Closterium sp. NIES-67]